VSILCGLERAAKPDNGRQCSRAQGDEYERPCPFPRFLATVVANVDFTVQVFVWVIHLPVPNAFCACSCMVRAALS
jgi:hypothetical protein